MSAEISVASLESEDDEFSMLQSQVDRAAKDLKGKKYIMDKDGNPILLNPVKGDNLPPFLMPVKMSVTNVPTAEEKAAAEAKQLVGVSGMVVLLGIFAFIASHAVGQGAVIWVFISEILPLCRKIPPIN